MSTIPELWSPVISNAEARRRYAQKVGDIDADIGCFLSFDAEVPVAAKTGALATIPVAVKDNIAVKGRPLTCASRILENLVSPYSATAVELLEKEGAVVVGKTNMDEFGMGSSTEHSALGTTVNPWNRECVPGGSSGGSAAAVAAGLVPLALGSDTGGSVRQPANFCGIYGLKPTYGVVSRYGLTAYASSLDVIGAMSADIDLLESAFSVMRSPDPRDQSSLEFRDADPGGRRVAVLDIEPGALDEEVEQAYRRSAEVLGQAGYSMARVRLSTLDLVVPAYYTIATAEASANLARFCGMRYGHAPDFAENPVELMRSARHEGFGAEVKLRILLGTYVLRSGFQDQYYGRAQKVRTLIRQEFSEIFRDADLLLLPVFPTQAFHRGDTEMDDYRQRLADVFTCSANLTGLPALAVPTGTAGGLPTGVQFMAPAFGERRLFDAARTLEPVFPVLPAPGALDPGSLI